MKNLSTVFMVGMVLALSACATGSGEAVREAESQAPYADARTQGSNTTAAEPMFANHQRK